MIDEKTIRCWWDIFKAPDTLTEVRILGKSKATYSGYFTDCETMLSEIRRNDGAGGIYATINSINDACAGREQSNRIIKAPKATTSDNEIDKRKLILIDFDPERPSDTNATDEEIKLAEAKMKEVYRFLRDQGFSAPVVAFSGNGFHLGGEFGVHIRPFVILAVSGILQIVCRAGHLAAVEELKPDLGVFLLVLGRSLEEFRNLDITVLACLSGIVLVLGVRLRFAGECGLEIGLCLGSFQFGHNKGILGVSFLAEDGEQYAHQDINEEGKQNREAPVPARQGNGNRKNHRHRQDRHLFHNA